MTLCTFFQKPLLIFFFIFFRSLSSPRLLINAMWQGHRIKELWLLSSGSRRATVEKKGHVTEKLKRGKKRQPGGFGRYVSCF